MSTTTASTFSSISSALPKRLYITIATTTAREDLFQLFRRYGRVFQLSIPTSKKDGRVRGFAFVSYHRHEDAVRAMEELQGRRLDHWILHIQWATPVLKKKEEIALGHHGEKTKKSEKLSTTTASTHSATTLSSSSCALPNMLYVTIANTTARDDLFQLFRRYGRVSQLSIPTSKKDGRVCGFAFVSYHRHEDAVQAMGDLGRKLDNMIKHIQWATAVPKKK